MDTADNQPRLRLHTLTLENFRAIPSISLDLRRGERALDVVILAGDNGCGKTSILEAIAMVLGQQNLLPQDAAPISDETRFGARSFRLLANVGSPTADKRRLEFLELGPSNRGASERIQRLNPQVEYFSARREPEALGLNPDPRGARSERESRRLVELKRRLSSAYNRRLRAQLAGHPGISSPFDRVQSFFRRFNQLGWELDVIPITNDPGSGDEVVLREPRPIPDDVTSLAMARSLAPERPDIPRMVPLDRLSSGEMALLTFAGPLIFRDRPADIVLIDEPEQHLHEQWQRHLVRGLRELSPASQFIVSTHSREILESVLSDERFLLLRPGDPREQRSDDHEAPAASETEHSCYARLQASSPRG